MTHPAARNGDQHDCPDAVLGLWPHGGGPITAMHVNSVRVNGRTIAVATDQALCDGPPDAIVTGSQTVHAGSLMAARDGDRMLHGGTLAPPLSPNVNVGGPRAGATLGNLAAARANCQQLGATRPSGSTQQTWGNCGCESVRGIVNRRRTQAGQPPIAETPFLIGAIENIEADPDPNPAARGGTYPAGHAATLSRHGIPNRIEPRSGNQAQDLARLGQLVNERRGVVTGHVGGQLWGNTSTVGHAVSVVGMVYDANGRPVQVIVNDTGNAPNCAQAYAAGTFVSSMDRDWNVTDGPVW